MILEEYFGTDGQRVSCQNGYAIKEQIYDGEGKMVACWFMDKDSELTTNISGVSGIKYIYDHDYQKVREEYYDVNGKPCVDNRGYHAVEWDCDSEGNIALQRFYDVSGDLIVG